MKRIFFLTIFILSAFLLKAQEQNVQIIYGKAVTFEQLPVRGIVVSSKNAGAKTQTDSLGRFMIACAGKDVVVFESKIFKTAKKKIKPNTTDSIVADLIFPPAEENVDIAIAYGYITEKDRVTAISRLPKGKDYCRYTSMLELLSENFTSLSVRGGCITIRGNETFNGPECALLVVDGNEVRSLDCITPCDVKDITVIKDGSTAVYGSRGGNGAVIVTLKKGGE